MPRATAHPDRIISSEDIRGTMVWGRWQQRYRRSERSLLFLVGRQLSQIGLSQVARLRQSAQFQTATGASVE
jgi:hypothetical protein